MIRQNLILPVVISLACAGTIVVAQDPLPGGGPAVYTATTAATDSLRHARLTTAAEDSYSRLRAMRFDGFDEKEYYPELMECYVTNVAVLDSLPGDPHSGISKAVILDTYRDLLDGAYYYSGLGDNETMTRFARAYLDVADLEAMEGETLRYDERALPSLAYIAASGAYNAGQFADAIRYFLKYLSTPDTGQRENVYTYLGQACLYAGDFDRGVSSMAEAAVLYPSNYNVLTLGLQACIDGKRGENIPFFLDRALTLRPDDEQLLNIQGKIYEDHQEYRSALDVFQRLDEMKPDNLGITKHLALCYFNLGVHHYNEAVMSGEEKVAKRNKRQSNAYFGEAERLLKEVIANDPTAVKYLRALAVTYGCRDDKENFDGVNTKLRALGQDPERSMMPSLMVYNDDNTSHFATESDDVASLGEIPDYSDFGRTYVTDGLAKWAARGTYEKVEEYTKRVSEANSQTEYVRLCKEAEKEYIEKYGRRLKIKDMRLGDYDPDHESYLIHTDFGDLTLGVPVKNGEAEIFASTWDKIQLRAPRFYIKNDRPALSSVTFVTNGGKSYTYDAYDAATYAYTDVIVDFNSILRPAMSSARSAPDTNMTERTATVITRQSDVDKDIPVVKRENGNTVALIIANENYRNVANVESALHDGEVFREYCLKTLGIPEHRVKLVEDGLYADIQEGIAFAANAVRAIGPDANLIVYYAGHGMPDENTKDAYLLPVEANVNNTRTCIPLGQFYDDLNGLGVSSVIVFLDACFSGAQRGEGMLASARGVAIKANDIAPKGNMFVLSAASDKETAMPYTEKNHGMFTYFLLKKLQQSKGSATLKDLSDYVKKNVIEQSNIVNRKSQTPQITLSGNMATVWNSRGLRE